MLQTSIPLHLTLQEIKKHDYTLDYRSQSLQQLPAVILQWERP